MPDDGSAEIQDCVKVSREAESRIPLAPSRFHPRK